jgi:hypothetical protein
LRELVHTFPKIRLVGDTLPNAFKGFSSHQMKKLVDLDEGGKIRVHAA